MKKLTSDEKLIACGILILVPSAGTFFILFALFAMGTLMNPNFEGVHWWIETGRRMFFTPDSIGPIVCATLSLLGLGLICFGSWKARIRTSSLIQK